MALLKSAHARRALFVAEYLKDFNGTRAAVRAGFSEHTAAVQGSRLLRHPDVAAAVTAGALALRESIDLEARDLTRMWSQIVTTDRNDLAEVRRVPCRWCWSPNDDPQETRGERSARRREYDKLIKQITAMAKPDQALILPEFPELGGVGYDARKPINPACGECFGDGESRLVVKDTRFLSPGARAVYEGVDVKSGELVIKMHSREKAAELIARKLGLLKDGGTPTGAGDDSMRNVTPDDPQEASRVYLKLVGD